MGQHSQALKIEGHPATYSPAVISEGGRLAHVAGQVAIRDGVILHPGDVAAQTTVAFENLTDVIERVGGTWSDVCMLRCYLTQAADLGAFGEVYRATLPNPPPAATVLVVRALFRPEVLVEIDAVVALG